MIITIRITFNGAVFVAFIFIIYVFPKANINHKYFINHIAQSKAIIKISGIDLPMCWLFTEDLCMEIKISIEPHSFDQSLCHIPWNVRSFLWSGYFFRSEDRLVLDSWYCILSYY